MFDQDGSGEIELDEISRAFRSMGKLTDGTRAQLEAHFAFMDSDGSGALTVFNLRIRRRRPGVSSRFRVGISVTLIHGPREYARERGAVVHKLLLCDCRQSRVKLATCDYCRVVVSRKFDGTCSFEHAVRTAALCWPWSKMDMH